MNITMPYSQAKNEALKKWRQKNIEKVRETTRAQVKRNREKWSDFKAETKRLSHIMIVS